MNISPLCGDALLQSLFNLREATVFEVKLKHEHQQVSKSCHYEP
jgi:hypothetical protein